jgi:SAM-dependent methyltransferase
MPSYDEYVKDAQFLDSYNAYQRKYAGQVPERDKVTLKLLARLTGGKGKVLDIGCSTGNLLLHISRFLSKLQLTGGELAESSLEAARANADLANAGLEKMDMLAIPYRGEFDVIVSNAVTYLFDDAQFATACRSVGAALKPGGSWIDFDWFSPFSGQRYTIMETTPSHPHGLNIHVRPYDLTEQILRAAGFEGARFEPFDIPIDLPLHGYEGDPLTYTVKADAKRLQFRGALFQPWCHLVARH